MLARSNGLKLKCLNVGFVSYKQAAFLLHRTLTDGLEWCGLLVDYLAVLSAIHCRGSTGEQVMEY